MSITKTNPLKDNPTEGYEQDFDPNTDAANVRGVYIQKDTGNDTAVVVTRDASDNMTFTDAVTGTKTLAQLATASSGITAAQHKALHHLIHFIDDGPSGDFGAGPYYKATTGTTFPTAEIWYTDSGMTMKIVEHNTTWTGVKPTSEVWKMYDTDGTTVLVTVTDTITYSGVFETSRSRAIT